MVFVISYAMLYGILALWIVGFIFTFRKRLTCMVGMMAAMALGMTVGLGIGTVLAYWLPGQMFEAIMSSIFIGGIVGAIAGAPISLMAVLDGLLSGIMSGMMGVMLAAMIPANYAEDTVKIVTIICVGIIFLLYIMLQGEIKSEELSRKPLFTKPSSMFVFILLCFSIIFQTTELSASDDSSHHQVALPSDTTNGSQTHNSAPKELIIQASEFSFSPEKVDFKAGETIKITLENNGNEEHDFEVIGTGIHVHAKPGKSSSVSASIDKAGIYTTICTLPGHKEAGMISIIKVST